ncbi:MAG: methyltransferase domain-containing protein [bacterium]|nr:methyltransferase domain-containing protein [bacterium]
MLEDHAALFAGDPSRRGDRTGAGAESLVEQVEALAEALVLLAPEDEGQRRSFRAQLRRVGELARELRISEVAGAAETATELVTTLGEAAVWEAAVRGTDAGETLAIVGEIVGRMQEVCAEARRVIGSEESAGPGTGCRGKTKAPRAAGDRDAAPVESPELPADFLSELVEHLEQIDESLLALLKDRTDRPAVDRLLGVFHSIKGAASLLGLDDVATLAHETEALLEAARDQRLLLDADALDAVFEASNVLEAGTREIVEALAAGREVRPSSALQPLLDRLRAAVAPGGPRGAQAQERNRMVGRLTTLVGGEGGNGSNGRRPAAAAVEAKSKGLLFESKQGLRGKIRQRWILEDRSGLDTVYLVDAVCTNGTSFFREREHFHFMFETLRRWLAGGARRIRLWSAAASSGEEPYSMAMVAAEAMGGVNATKADVKILATDLSTRILERCRQGVYSKERISEVPEAWRRRYFEPVTGEDGRPGFAAGRALCDRIVFSRLNLSEPPFPMEGPLDMIFCRNVMIYFDAAVRRRLLAEIHRLLKPGGYLFVGHAESLAGLMSDLRPVQPGVYRNP